MLFPNNIVCMDNSLSCLKCFYDSSETFADWFSLSYSFSFLNTFNYIGGAVKMHLCLCIFFPQICSNEVCNMYIVTTLKLYWLLNERLELIKYNTVHNYFFIFYGLKYIHIYEGFEGTYEEY